MKIVIAYFSQSGNTKKVAERISFEMESSGNQVILTDICSTKEKDLLECDILGVGSPTFESHCPKPVDKFIKQLPELLNKKALFLLPVEGSQVILFRILKKDSGEEELLLWDLSLPLERFIIPPHLS